MSLSNFTKKMLNIKENNFKILNIEDVKIKNIVTKQISAILSKKKALEVLFFTKPRDFLFVFYQHHLTKTQNKDIDNFKKRLL